MTRRARAEHVPYTEADRQYFRNRGNDRVRQRRMVRHTARFTLLAVLHVVVVATLAVGLGVFARRAAHSQRFALERIEVQGLARLPDASIDRLLEPFLGANLLDLDLDRVAAAVRHEPWVRDVRIRRVLPGTMKVRIRERVPVARVALDGVAAPVDAAGEVLPPLGEGTDEGLPWIVVPEGAGDTAVRASVAAALRGLVALHDVRPEWYPEIAAIAAERDAFAVGLHDGTRVLLDVSRPDRNLDPWLRLRSEIERRVGVAETIDLRWGGRISVLPASVPSENGSEDGSAAPGPGR